MLVIKSQHLTWGSRPFCNYTYILTHHFIASHDKLVLNTTTGGLEKIHLNSALTFVPPTPPALPLLDPRDDHLPQFLNEKVIDYCIILRNLVESFKKKKYIFIEGKSYGSYLLHVWKLDRSPPTFDLIPQSSVWFINIVVIG